MQIIYLSDISQLNEALSYSEKTIMTGDITIAHELNKLNINYIDLWKFIDENSINKNWDRSYELSIKWCELNTNNFIFDGISYSDCLQQDLVYPFEAVLNAKEIYTKIFEKFKIEKIYGYFSESTAVISTGPFPTYKAVRSISESVLFTLAQNNNIEVIDLDKRNFNYKLKYKSQKKVTFEKHFLNHKNTYLKDNILIWTNFLPENEYIFLSKFCENNKLYNLKPISRNIINAIFKQDYITNNIGNINYVELFENDIDVFINSKYFHFQMKKILDEFHKSIYYLNYFKQIYNQVNPKFVIFGHEAFIQERILEKFLKSIKCKVVSLFHDSIGCDCGYRGLVGQPDFLIAWNEYSKNMISKYGFPKDKILVNGAIRFLNEISKYKIVKKNTFSKKVLILTAAINCDLASPISDQNIHLSTLNDLFNHIKLNPNFKFVIKSHPSFDYYDLYFNIFSQLDNVTFTNNLSFQKIDDNFDYCLMLNYMTTASIEAMLKNIPVFFVESAIYNIKDWTNPFPILKSNRVKNFIEFQNLIQKFYEDINIANHIIKVQKDILEYTIGIDSDKINNILLNNFYLITKEFKNDMDNNYFNLSNYKYQEKISFFYKVTSNNFTFYDFTKLLFKFSLNDIMNIYLDGKYFSKQKFPIYSILIIIFLLPISLKKFILFFKYYLLSRLNY